MQLYFVRHGESEANVRQVFSNWDRDPLYGLTDVGRAQVEDLAGRLAGVLFAAFYCSPVLRARQSADIVSARLGIDYVLTRALAEYDVGELEGKSDAASWQRYYAVRDTWFRDKDWTARIEGGESFEDIRARFVPFIEALLASSPPGPGLLLGHGARSIACCRSFCRTSPSTSSSTTGWATRVSWSPSSAHTGWCVCNGVWLLHRCCRE